VPCSAIRAAIEAREEVLAALVEGEWAHFSAGANIQVWCDAAATRDMATPSKMASGR
jgi:hypothetical protein